MSSFFEFLAELPTVKTENYSRSSIDRLALRRQHIIERISDEFNDASILDLGAHDGRWPFAYAAAGARSVLGLEGRAETAARYDAFPATPFKDRVKFVVGDFVLLMDKLIAEGRTFDIVSCLGVYYHTMHHYRMMIQMAAFKPKIIIIDTEMSLADNMSILIDRNLTSSGLNAISEVENQKLVPVGLPSVKALRFMASTVGYATERVLWSDVPKEQRQPVRDYYKKNPHKQRMTFVLRPQPAGAA